MTRAIIFILAFGFLFGAGPLGGSAIMLAVLFL